MSPARPGREAGLVAAILVSAAWCAASQVKAPLEQGIELYWSGQYRDSVDVLSPFCGSSSRADERVECLKYLAFSRVALGDRDGASGAFADLLAVDPRYVLEPGSVSPKIEREFEASRRAFVEDLFEAGKELYSQDRFAEARAKMEEVLDLDPKHRLALEYEQLARERAELEAALAEASKPAPAEASKPAPAEASKPAPAEASKPEPAEASKPEPAEASKPEPAEAPAPEPPEESADTDRVYRMTSGMTPPALLVRVDPDYPLSARRARREGTVVLTVVVDRDGAIGEAKVLRSVSPDLDRAALDAVLRWRYRPAMLDGERVAVASVIRLSFELE